MKVLRLSALSTDRLFLQEKSLVLISVRGWVEPQSQTPITPSEIEPATFRLVAQCSHLLLRRVPETSQVLSRRPWIFLTFNCKCPRMTPVNESIDHVEARNRRIYIRCHDILWWPDSTLTSCDVSLTYWPQQDAVSSHMKSSFAVTVVRC